MAVTGEWNRCPFCRTALWGGAPGADVHRVASKLVGRKRCPRCGADLWVVAFTDGAMFFIRQRNESLQAFLTSLAALISPKVRLSAAEIEAALGRMDALDLVEFVMEVEEAMQSQEPEPGSGG
jgi:hypothetical protein